MPTRAAIDSSMGGISTNFNGGEEGLLVAPLLAPAGPPLRGVIPASSLSQSADRCRQKFTDRMAERVGFEPTNTVRCYTLSRRAPSTARPPLHAAARVPEATHTIKFTVSGSAAAGAGAAARAGAQPPASRWQPYWPGRLRNAADGRGRHPSDLEAAAQASPPG